MIDFEIIQSAFTNLVANAIDYAPRLVTAFIILLAGWLLAKGISTLVQRLGEKLRLEELLDRTGIKAGLEKAQINRTGTQLLGMLLYWIIFLNFILIALESLGLTAVVEPLRNLIAFLPRLLAALATLSLASAARVLGAPGISPFVLVALLLAVALGWRLWTGRRG
ncbi:MAG: hypothetical protein KDD75_10510 [Caldilineaceae bacterium]|nr:hypothetical protein [Caldilineaceae bacterium]